MQIHVKEFETINLVASGKVLFVPTLLFWQHRGGFSSTPTRARSSESTLFWRHRGPGATLLFRYKINPALCRKAAHWTRSETQQSYIEQNKHGEDHLPTSFGTEARKRRRWRQDHYTSSRREFVWSFVVVFCITWIVCGGFCLLCLL